MPRLVFDREAQVTEARSRSYGLLASVYNLLPSPDFVAMIEDADVRSLFRSAIPVEAASTEQWEELEHGLHTMEGFSRQVREVKEEELLIRLGVDRTRLFRGVKRGYGPPPPYESVYIGGHSVMGESALQVKKAYADFGYCLPQGCTELPDYVGVELDFLRYLCSEEAEAWKKRNQSKALGCLNGESDFLCKHVVEWVPRFCDEVLASAEEGFYRGIALMTKAFVIIEAARLPSLVAQ